MKIKEECNCLKCTGKGLGWIKHKSKEELLTLNSKILSKAINATKHANGSKSLWLKDLYK